MKYSILCEKLSRSKSLPLVKMFLEVDAQSILTIQVYIVEECEIVYTEKTKTSALAYVKIERPAKKEIKSHQTRNNPLRPCLWGQNQLTKLKSIPENWTFSKFVFSACILSFGDSFANVIDSEQEIKTSGWWQLCYPVNYCTLMLWSSNIASPFFALHGACIKGCIVNNYICLVGGYFRAISQNAKHRWLMELLPLQCLHQDLYGVLYYGQYGQICDVKERHGIYET